MARRVGSDKLFKKKKSQKEKAVRKKESKRERIRVLIACEGEKTEPNYFRCLQKDKKIAATSLVIAGHRHNTPCGIVDDILSHLKGDSDFDHKWVIFDRDENGHTVVDLTMHLKKQRKKI